MTKKSPNVIFACEYLLGLNNKSNKKYGHNYQSGRNKDVDDMFDYFSNPKKSVVKLIDYYMGHTRREHYNLILEDGSVATKEEVEKRKNNYKKYIKNSNIWKGIISFNNEFIDQNISFENLEQRIAKEVMPNFLKYCGFKNVKDMDYVFSIHTNSKHYHIHLAFLEKKPNYVYRNGKVGYRRLGMLSSDEKNYLKRLVQLAVERDKLYTPLLKQVNNDIDDLKKYFNVNEKNFVLKNINEIQFEENILKLGELLKQYRSDKNMISKKMNYNSIRKTELGKEILSLTRNIKKYLYNDETSLLYNEKNKVNESLNKLNEYFNKLDSDNNMNSNILKNDLVKDKEKYIDNYISNAIINHSLYKYEKISMTIKSKKNLDRITIEDIIQELAYQNSLTKKRTNDFDRRKEVLTNFFENSSGSTKLPNKYKMERAIKNINNEMDQSAEKFSELFNYGNSMNK